MGVYKFSLRVLSVSHFSLPGLKDRSRRETGTHTQNITLKPKRWWWGQVSKGLFAPCFSLHSSVKRCPRKLQWQHSRWDFLQ